MKGIINIAVVLFFLFNSQHTIAQNFGGNSPSIHWKSFNSPSARVIFPKGLDSQANRILSIVEHLNTITAPTIGGRTRKWNIVLQNQTTIPNAYVRLAPVLSELNLIPGQNNFEEGSIRWDDNLIIHENRHMQQFSNFNKGLTKVFSFLLGQEGQLLANGITIPNYFFEGDAVWQETLVSAQGRGRLPNFFNGFKALWQGNKNYSWMKLRSGSYKDFVPDHYQLGYQLVAYGVLKYGDDFWRKVTNDAVQFKGLFYSFNKAIGKYSGTTYQKFCEAALAYFRAADLPRVKVQEQFDFITPTEKNNVVDYLFPAFISDDSILVTKRSYKNSSAFYILAGGKEKMIRVKNSVIDDYYSYSNGKIVYASFQSDPRWGNRDYSVLQVVDTRTGEQKQISFRSKYFSPAFNKKGTELLAVRVNPDGTNNLVRLDASTGTLVGQLPNPNNYFFTQSNYIDASNAVSAVRNPDGKMALIRIDLLNGQTEALTPFTLNVLGYPMVNDKLVWFSMMNDNADKVFVLDLTSKKISRVTNNTNGLYAPVLNSKGDILVAAFTAGGYRLATFKSGAYQPEEITVAALTHSIDLYAPSALKGKGDGSLYSLKESHRESTKYRQSFQLFNFHSARPLVNDPEWGYSLYSDNILSNFHNTLSYTYNRNELSHNIEYNSTYAGWFPVLSMSVKGSFNRSVDTALGKSISFNSAKLNTAIYIPLSFTGGRTSQYLSFGIGYNAEQLYYTGIGKNIFSNRSFDYGNAFLSFSNISRQARQNVNPRWAQTFNLTYRQAYTFLESRKFVGRSSLYFPGLFTNHSIVIDGAFQKRDSIPDIFSNTFSYSRGYLGLSTRRMYKIGVNYQLPILYPDRGIGNIVFLQRIRTNAFYDYTNARARLNGVLKDIINRSAGTEIFFDTKVWNELPVSFGIRYSRLLDNDLRNPGAVNRWEFIVPIGLIPD